MQRFWWPGYEMQLLEQLQRQQNSALLCDTLLQTEGISVPTHSCVLAALSPYFSQRLSESPSPPLGQKRRLHLQEVTAQTLLKLVGLLYSGQMEVRSSKEQNDVLTAAHKFGISELVLGCRDEGRKGAELLQRRQRVHKGEATESRKSLKMQDARVQTEMSGNTDTDHRVKRTSFESVGTQTISNNVMSVASAGPLSDQTTPPTPERTSCVATLSTSLQSQNTTQFSLTPHPTIHSDPESTAGLSSDCVTRPSFSPASSRYTETLRTSLNDDGSSPRTRKKNISKQSPECGEGVFDRERPGQEDGNAAADAGNSAQLVGACRERTLGERNETRNPHFISRGKNLEKMKQTEQMTDAAQVSVKMKLRRRTEGEVWQIVADAEETASVPSNLKQSCPNQKTPQADPQVVQSPTHSVLPVQNPESLKVQPVFTSSPQPPKQVITSSDSEARTNSWLSMNQSSELESESLSPPQGPLEESDEQIDKLLEDVITCMNIRLQEDNCKRTHTNHNGAPTFWKVPATENGLGPTPLDADVSATGFVYYQDLGRAGGHSTTDTAIHCCYGAQDQPSFTDPSAVPSYLQQQLPSEFSSSIRSLGQMNGWSCAGEGSSPYPVTCFSSGQKLHCFSLEQTFSQEDPNIEFLSLSHESETQSADGFSLPCMHDLRLPQCLSPLALGSSAALQQPDPSVSGQPSVQTLPWLTEAACMLQFPLDAITACKGAFQLPATSSSSCGAAQSLRCGELKPQNGGEAGSLKTVGEKEKKCRPKRKSGPMKRKKNTQDAAEDAAPPKRKWRRRPKSREESEVSTLDSIPSKHRDTAKTVCSVSLSCNNVLVKEREKSSLRKARPGSPATRTKKSREATNLGTEQTRIGTRGFVKRTQRNTSNTISDKGCVLIPVIRRAVMVQAQDPAPPKRKRGRPRKIKVEKKLPENVCVDNEISGRNEAGEKQSEVEAQREEIKCSAREEEAGQLKKTTSPECSGKNKPNNIKRSERQKQSLKVTLKEFRNLIKRKQLKTRKGTEVQDGTKSVYVGDLEKVREVKWNESDAEVEVDQNGGAKIQHQALPAVDENHNLLPNSSAAQRKPTHQDVTGRSETRKSCVSGHGDKPASPCGVLEEEMAKLLSEREQSAKSPGQGADSSLTRSCCNRRDDDEEVDVMIYSPDKGSSTKEFEERVVVIPDEEEEDEEDAVEIDVTGDEAE